jgi:hypothetical protein
VAKRKIPSITQDDLDGLMQEIEAMRPTSSPYTRKFTAEQDRALLAARSGEPGRRVKWDDLIDWWRGKWGNINSDTLRRRLRELEAEQ